MQLGRLPLCQLSYSRPLGNSTRFAPRHGPRWTSRADPRSSERRRLDARQRPGMDERPEVRREARIAGTSRPCRASEPCEPKPEALQPRRNHPMSRSNDKLSLPTVVVIGAVAVIAIIASGLLRGAPASGAEPTRRPAATAPPPAGRPRGARAPGPGPTPPPAASPSVPAKPTPAPTAVPSPADDF